MRRTCFALAALGCGWLIGSNGWAQQELPPPLPAPVEAGRPIADEHIEFMTRGPVHEAFAQAVIPSVEVGLTVRKEPPPMIEEMPPAHRPSGDDIAWIPGYWGWDDERNDFIWISGVWRAVPPGREWVPGYWTKVPDGYQWISGYWADMRDSEVEYLPAPPETTDAGPTTEAPTGSEIWVPGCWMWQQNRYVWRPGYWAKGHPDWIWTNAHYVYTTRGYLYVSGYWDFLVPQRGVLFAPVAFKAPVTRTFVYTPRLVVNTTHLVDHLFLRPTYRHYYFGDYYAADYRQRGILPWFVFSTPRYGYDPIFSYNRWRYRDDRDWVRRLETRYDDLRDREDGRPPRSYVDFQRWQRDSRDYRNSFLVGNLNDYIKSAGRDLKFREFSDVDRRSAGGIARELDTYRQRRMALEAEKTVRRDGDDRRPDRVQVLKPPSGLNPDRGPQPQREFPPSSIDPPGRDLLPGRDDRPERDPVRPKLDRNPLNPDNDPPRTEPRIDKAPDPRPARAEAPRNPKNLPGPLNDIRNPPEKPRETAPPPSRDRTGPLNDVRDKADPPKATPRIDRPPLDSPRVTPRTEPRPEPRLDPRPDPRPTPKTSTAPRSTPPGLDRTDRGPGADRPMAPRTGSDRDRPGDRSSASPPRASVERPSTDRPSADRPNADRGNRGNSDRSDKEKEKESGGKGKGKRD
jgi:hypothetical protein